jgi:hypothetical protein
MDDGVLQHKSRSDWASAALDRLEAWGTLALKDEEVKLSHVMACIKTLTAA